MPAQGGSASLGTVTFGNMTPGTVAPGRVSRRLILCALLVGLAALIAGCGSSSKPGFCKDKSALQKSVTSISVSGGVSSLKSQLQTIESQAKSLVSSAKSDFPDQTTAIDGAVSKLQTDVKSLSSSPTPAQLASVAVSVKDTVTSVGAFTSASKDKCQ